MTDRSASERELADACAALRRAGQRTRPERRAVAAALRQGAAAARLIPGDQPDLPGAFAGQVRLARIELDAGRDDSIELVFALARMADILNRATLHWPVSADRSPAELAERLTGWLDEIPAAKVAGLLDVTPSTLRAWRHGRAPRAAQERRLRDVAGCVGYIRGSLTQRGVLMWFDNPRYQLHGRTPRDMLAIDPRQVRRLAHTDLEGTYT